MPRDNPVDNDVIGFVVSLPQRGLPSSDSIPVVLIKDMDIPVFSILKVEMKDSRFALLRVVRLKEVDPGALPGMTKVRHEILGDVKGPPPPGSFSLLETEIIDVVEKRDGHLISLGPILIPKSRSPVYLADDETIRAVMGDRKYPVEIGFLKGTEVGVSLDAQDFLRHVIVVGTTGTGKSWLRGILMEKLHDLGVPQLSFDPNGEYETAVRELGGVNVIPGVNYRPSLRSLSPEIFMALLGDRLPTPFQRVIARSGFEEFLREKSGTLTRFIPNSNELDELLEKINEAADRYNARTDTRENVLARVSEAVWEIGIFGSGFADNLEGRTLENLLREERLVNVVLRNMNDIQLQTVMSTLLKDLIGLRELNRVPPTIVSFDEAHRVIPRRMEGAPAGQIVKNLLRYGRHIGIGIIVVTQFPDSVDQEAVRLPATRVIFALDVDQVGAIRGLLMDLPESIRNLLPKLERGTAFVSGTKDVISHTAYVDISSERRTTHGGRTPDLLGGHVDDQN